MRALPVLLLVLLWAMTARPGFARDYENWLQGGAAVRGVSTGNWSGNVAAGLGAVPDYFGASDVSIEPLPGRSGVARDVFRLKPARIGLERRARIRDDRGPPADDRLGTQGQRQPPPRRHSDIGRSLEAGLFAVRYLGPWRIDADVRKGLSGGHEGIHAKAGVALGNRIARDASIIVGASTHFAGRKYSLAYFGQRTFGFTDVTATLIFVREFGNGVYASLQASTAVLCCSVPPRTPRSPRIIVPSAACCSAGASSLPTAATRPLGRGTRRSRRRR